MIADQYYMTTFFTVITILSMIGILPLLRYRTLEKFPEANLLVGTILLLVIVTLFIGLRNPFGSWRYYGDTYKYTTIYLNIQRDPLWESGKDFGFYYYMKFLAKFFNIQTFYLITAILYVFPVYFSFQKWFKKYAFFAVVMYVTSMSFWPFGINGMRNGLATSFFIFALAFNQRKLIMYALIALSISFHTSMALPTLALIIAQFYRNTKVLLGLWLVSIPISFLFGKRLLTVINFLVTSSIGLVDDRGDFSAIDNGVFARSSFRIDFIIYSGIVIYLGYYFIYKYHFKNVFFSKIFNLYIISNTIWLYFIYFPYTNRIAYLSWFLIPVLVVYPIIYATNLKNQSYFMAGAISVSLFFVWLLTYL
ncbi:hypothetical protein GCM10011344_06820 [Dokdonia pacifica]|uniref:EpsG family protein n=1 Tax=Dokdonia pacifica TaxID=1627892 RepID=A0A238Z2F9_9FLAO|nr:EpsG family protein [Dokdonia pacifica]GGG08859.1 hypothetical protein GCM10011344_06820 [Dokdonia pacifica]SNR77024.1 EpsG family protein [Dokdonia pacifica]